MDANIHQVDYAELERFAAEHDLNAEDIMKWRPPTLISRSGTCRPTAR